MAFNLEIISPSETLINDEVDLVIIPGVEGDLGILSNHMPIITTLRLGIIFIYKNKKIHKKFLVNGGILEMSDNKCSLLTEDISEANDKVFDIVDDDVLATKKNEILKKQFYS